jgi:chitodextrinase
MATSLGTPAPPDTTAPTAPTGLTATPTGSSQINLSWTAATDNVAVTGYRVERCAGASCNNFAQIGTPTATSYPDTGLTAGSAYRYRVAAVDGAGNVSGYSTTASATTATPDTTPPSAPTGVTATPASASQINLAWTASTDNVAVTGYRVERCAGANCSNFAQVGTPAATTFGDIGLAPSTAYSYRVRAVDAAGNLSDYSTVVSTSTPAGPDTTAPTAPTGLTATAASTSQINLAWTASTDNVGVTGYRVERCQGANCSNFAQVGTPTTTTFSSTGLAANTAYRFRVRAVDAAGNLSVYSAIASATTQAADTTRPTAPSGLAGTAAGPTLVNLTWTASTDNVGVTGYRIERCQGSSCTNYAQIGTSTSASYADATATASTAFRYRVRANDAAGNLSTYSNVVTVTTPAIPDTTAPSAPTGTTATAVAATGINVGWTASSDNVGVTGYRMERCQGPGCSNFAQVGTPTGTSFGDTGLTPSTTYSYRVLAVDAAGNVSGYSPVASATTPATSPLPPGLVAGYSFNTGSGTTLPDVSGNGNNGTITSATWSTQGKFGGALSFNGSSSIVRVASSASLNLSSAMTLSAWINPSASQSGWRTIVQKETDAYFLNAGNNSPLQPAGGGTFAGATQWLSGPTANPLNTWTHVALTYDGTILRLYVNGTQVTTQAAGGTIQATSNPLWIGGNSPYGEFFQGLLDDVRVYNRALTQTEIQTDMVTALNG